MKIKDGYILRKVAGVDMVIPVGNNIVDFNGVITLNESAAFLWKLLNTEMELDSLSEALQKEYGIEMELAVTDAREFVSMLKQAAIIG